ncbi:MAG: multicopper oxidase domain-containing protein, partial [Mesorhizobium sp.]
MTGLTRRTVLKASAAVAGSFGLGWLANAAGAALAAPEPKILKATPTTALLTGSTPTQKVLTYGDAGMPPVLRMTKGKPFAARLVNGLDEPTTIHWHGVRVPNKMDGVPFMIQPYVYTGDHFDYAFTPPDAGTFWYHPHCNTLEQMGHGLTGVIVVENPGDPAFDAEVVLNLRDWRLDGDGRFLAPF